MHYLLKTEPGTYSFADLQRDGTTVWDGVTNPQAVKFLREMKAGSKLIIYHTGEERRAVGTATATSVDASDPKKPLVTIKAGKPLTNPVSLADAKADPKFKDSLLVRMSRLSVVPLNEDQYSVLLGK
jgi:predicted RNA-binding protein with PUA-like domain